jgi:hypothetical protein
MEYCRIEKALARGNEGMEAFFGSFPSGFDVIIKNVTGYYERELSTRKTISNSSAS